MFGIITLVSILACVQALPANVDLTNGRNSTPLFDSRRRILRDGYFSEVHNVITSDGYILEINRIPNGRFQFGTVTPGTKPVVYLQHGLQSSALAFIALGPGLSLAYTLADAGYDVWMGNARGIMNSRRHIWLDPDSSEDRERFFDFTFDDVATKDLPTMIDYILRVTRQQKLNYIGHSQGGTAFLALNSLRPEYNQKFNAVHLLAGVGYQQYFPNNILTFAARNTDIILNFAMRRGTLELFGPNSRQNSGALEYSYEDSVDDRSLISIILAVMNIMKEIKVSLETIAGASIKQYAHYGQNIRDNKFRRWNYNPLQNLLKYGSFNPPIYDISLINVDLTMHYTVGDILLDERDVLNMAKDIPNAKVRRVSRDSFTHFDFVIAADSKELVNDYIIEKLNEKNK